MVMSLSHGDQTLWPVYISIENLNAKIRRSQKRPKTLLLSSIPIIYERSEDANNKDKNLKAKIYNMALKTMLKCTYPSFPFIDFKKMRHWWCYSTAWVYEKGHWIGVCGRLQKTLLFCTGRSYGGLRGASLYHRHENKHAILDLPCSTKRKRVSNPVVRAANPLVNLESGWMTTQWPGNSAE